MIKIIIDNSFSRIEGLTSTQFNGLRQYLSYKTDPQAAFFAGGNFPRVRFLMDSRGSFPTGLINRVKLFLRAENLGFTAKDVRIKPQALGRPYALTPGAPEPYVAQNEAAQSARITGRGTISMPTGTGKSLVIALIVADLNVRTLVVVPNLEIKKQLINDLARVLPKGAKVTVENIDSKGLQTPQDFDCLIIDEAHHVAAKTYQKLNKAAWKGIYYRFFLTATPFRNNKEETLLFEGIAGDVIYNLSYRRAISEGYIVPVEAYYIELPKVKTDAYSWAEVYKELVVNNKLRNEYIAVLMNRLNVAGVSTLTLVKEVKHGANIQAIFGAPFANGQDMQSRVEIRRFNERFWKTLIGTTGLLGEGVDTKPCEYVIIAGLGKAKSAFMQQVGRAVRKYPGKESAKVIIFKDPSHKFLTRHFKAQCAILKDEYGVTPFKLEL